MAGGHIYRLKDDRERWRAALEQMGLPQVRRTLMDRPDRPPEETFHDLTPVPPFPTRRFVQEWVIERENRIFRLTRSVVFTIAVLMFCLLFVYFAQTAWKTSVPQPPYTPAPVANPNSPTVQ